MVTIRHPSPLPPDPALISVGSPLPPRRTVVTIGSPLPPDPDVLGAVAATVTVSLRDQAGDSGRTTR
jgi:hypothetical protein